MKEIISIIIPMYNSKQYIERCLKSVLRQTYSSLEIIVVDDGSTDNCSEIVRMYSNTDSRIKLIRKENGGLSDARNHGIEAATGSYISFLDSDDWIHYQYIEQLYTQLKSHDGDISICDFKKVNDCDNESYKKEIENYELSTLSNVEALELFEGEYGVQIVIACGKLFKIELFDDIRFPLNRIHEDEFTTYKLLYKANKIVFLFTKMLFYYQHSQSIMGKRKTITQRIDFIDALNERINFFEKVNVNKNVIAKSYKILFVAYLLINREIQLTTDKNEEFNKKIEIEIKNVYHRMKKYKFPIKFKMFTCFYFLFPNTVFHVLEVQRKVQRYNKL